MFGIGTQEILFILLIVLLFFGGKKIPELMKGLGKGVKSFKDGMNGVETPQDKSDKVEEAESEKTEERKAKDEKSGRRGYRDILGTSRCFARLSAQGIGCDGGLCACGVLLQGKSLSGRVGTERGRFRYLSVDGRHRPVFGGGRDDTR